MTLPRLLVGAAASILLATAADAAIVVVHVFNMDYSINPQGQPIVDPVINVGDTVRWLFDAFPHTTTSVQGQAEQWNSFFVAQGETFDHTFTTVGTFHYFCVPHGFDRGDGTAGGMAGTVTVLVPAPATTAVLGCAAAGFAARRRRMA